MRLPPSAFERLKGSGADSRARAFTACSSVTRATSARPGNDADTTPRLEAKASIVTQTILTCGSSRQMVLWTMLENSFV
jgi:hypothetical protein